MFTFTGDEIQLYGKKEPWGGIGAIYIDGEYIQDVSFNGSSQSDVLIFENTQLKSDNKIKSNVQSTISEEPVIYPNPIGSGELAVNLQTMTNGIITIMDITGKIFHTSEIINEQLIAIPYGKLTKGVSLVTVTTEDNAFVKRIIVY